MVQPRMQSKMQLKNCVTTGCTVFFVKKIQTIDIFEKKLFIYAPTRRESWTCTVNWTR